MSTFILDADLEQEVNDKDILEKILAFKSKRAPNIDINLIWKQDYTGPEHLGYINKTIHLYTQELSLAFPEVIFKGITKTVVTDKETYVHSLYYSEFYYLNGTCLNKDDLYPTFPTKEQMYKIFATESNRKEILDRLNKIKQEGEELKETLRGLK